MIVQNWRRIARYAWSLRFVALAAFFEGLEAVLPLFIDSVPRNIFAILSMCAILAAGITRFIAQPKIERRKIARD